jgi:hypothetical protein
MVTETFPWVTEASPPKGSSPACDRRTIESFHRRGAAIAPGRTEGTMVASTNVLKARGAFPRRIGRGPVAMAVAVVTLVAGTYLWQHARVTDQQVALEKAAAAEVAAGNQATALEGQVADLQARIEALSKNAEALKAGMSQSGRVAQHLEARLNLAEQNLRKAEAHMNALLGAPLADGRYFGDVIVVGANQSPPRLVIDLAQWLTGDAAHEAELEYGVPPEGLYDNFIENENPAWHTVVIAPTATVSIIGPSGYTEPLGTGTVGTDSISVDRFAKMVSLNRLYNPVWFDVSNGQITAIWEEYTS